MSKKKTLSTMSLKDFHGGSIPSDLALPSAPGVLARSDSDRSVSTNWGNNLGRSDLRSRPQSSGAAHNLDEKPLVLSHSAAPIGQNFDEEERKPLNGVFAPRQTISSGSVHTSSPVHQDMKLYNVSSVRVSDRSVSSPSLVNSSYLLRAGGGNHFAVSSQPPTNNNGKRVSNLNIPIGNNGQGINNSQPNAWGVRKEVMAIEEMAKPSLLSGPDALLKISQASALEKVSSGMWQSKKPSQLLPHSPYSRVDNSNVLGGMDVVSKRADYNALQGSQVEQGQVAEGRTKCGGRELPKKYIEEIHIGGGSLLAQASYDPEISVQLNSGLLQKTGPLETSENDGRQGYQQPVVACKVESGNELYRTVDSLKGGTTVAEGGNQMIERAVERPKLNLKPRSRPLDQSDGRLEKDRETLFGGGRPRELVLKERGIDEIAIGNLDIGQELSRVNTTKNEATSVPSTLPNENAENLTYEKRIGKNFERKEQHMGQGKNNQGRNRRIENCWGSRDAEKQQEDRRPEPDTWRKPIVEENPTSDYVSGICHGKIVSSLDLAQAFSKSVSDPARDRNSSQRGLPGHSNQMPFSRLTNTGQLNSAPTARHRINGY